ncbi:Multicopper oxidase [Micromonospora pallida]|uniref:Multicopper oxidase n=1 Tax=Micromonospora pallida TaxID=145854 RepID=A0A1C6SV30_9ACTN|nr:multicopper oxidase domain-containing protein [Micromonospora pallida]SCL33381.1 Multicopper oxidase [Micromonospora pallida]
MALFRRLRPARSTPGTVPAARNAAPDARQRTVPSREAPPARSPTRRDAGPATVPGTDPTTGPAPTTGTDPATGADPTTRTDLAATGTDLAAAALVPPSVGLGPPTAALDPAAAPRFFGPEPNLATSPRPRLDPDGRVVPGTGLRKFVDALPGLGPEQANELGGYLPVAVPDTISFPGCDYYEIGLQEYVQRLHRDLPPTRLRGYRQLNLGTDQHGHNTVRPPARAYHLGPMIVARRDRPVRIKFINQLPTGRAGDLFLPVDPTLPGAGIGPLDGPAPYPQNRAVLCLQGVRTAWISAGNPTQWVTPAGEITPYPTGPGLTHVPDMPSPGAGATTLYFPNDQSGRLMWFHDNALGLSRLTTHSGQLAPYLLTDPAEERLVDEGVLPADQVPLMVTDRTFVPDDAQLAAEDPTWDRDRWGACGSLWYPHVYQPRQNPFRPDGRNPIGRWDYGPWCRHPEAAAHGPTSNPYHDPVAAPEQPPLAPGVPHPSVVPHVYGDTPLVNGAAYPYLVVEPRAYRFRILNACPDRSLNLQLYRARSDGPMWHADGNLADAGAGEVPMVEAVRTPGHPTYWPTDGRDGGVPDPRSAGPEIIRIGNECGLLPAPVVLPNRPVGYRYDRLDPGVLNVDGHTLLLAPGERADVVVDFATVPPGSTLILYNDCPAPLPGGDPRYDHHAGSPAAVPGYGPDTRTLLQFRVAGTPADRYDLDRLRDELPAAYAASQPPPIVPQPAYDQAFGTRTERETVVPANATAVSFTPVGATGPVTLPVVDRAVRQVFEPDHGRLAGRLAAPLARSGDDGDGSSLPCPGGDGSSLPRSGSGDGNRLPRSGSADGEPVPREPADPPTEILYATDPAVPVGSPTDGTQLWRIRGEDRLTQPLHFGGGDVQLVSRVARDGTVRPTPADERGWKETVRIDPGEDVVVAVRPVPPGLPFTVDDCVRPLDPTDGDARPVGLGWEYRWHSQLAGLRDQGMSRPLVVRVSPRAPTGLTATPVPGSAIALPAIALTWTDNGDRPPATRHRLERATSATFAGPVTVLTVAATATRYVDATVTPGVTYHYRIRAENAVACSVWSNSVLTAVRLAAPTGLTAVVPTTAPLRVALRWTNRSFATGVDVQRATNPTFTSGPATTAVGIIDHHLDPTVAPETTYYYRVRTTYLGTASPWSTVGVVTTPPMPRTPTMVIATACVAAPESATVVLRWTSGTATGTGCGFVVERAADSAFARELTAFTVSGRGFTNTGLGRGVTYWYRVRAFNVVGSSAFTAPVPVTTPT